MDHVIPKLAAYLHCQRLDDRFNVSEGAGGNGGSGGFPTTTGFIGGGNVADKWREWRISATLLSFLLLTRQTLLLWLGCIHDFSRGIGFPQAAALFD
ncbi:hypothetical protein QWY74_07335 [Halomonas almeriensis]|nr:hypothetical protein [Halomonas almeriensis]